MTHFNWRTLSLLALTACASAYAAPAPHRLSVQVNEKRGQWSTALEYRLWSGHPYVKLKDTWALNWQPYFDNVHGLADVAGCIRLEKNSTRAVGVWRFAGARGVSEGSEMPRLPVPTRTVNYELWLPLDSVAALMGYKSSFDAAKQHLTLNYVPGGGDVPDACQEFMRSGRY